jgi:hypothetical protein
MTVTKSLERILMDLTGEPRPDVALHVALRDAVAHRLELVESEISKMEGKYHLTFPDFKTRWEQGKIDQKYSYEVEKDYWEWEGFVSRKNKLQEISKWLL